MGLGVLEVSSTEHVPGMFYNRAGQPLGLLLTSLQGRHTC